MDYTDHNGMPHHLPDGTPDDPIYVRPVGQQYYSSGDGPIDWFQDFCDWLEVRSPGAAFLLRLAGFLLFFGFVLWVLFGG